MPIIIRRKKKKKITECEAITTATTNTGVGNAVPFDPESGMGSGDKWGGTIGGVATQAAPPKGKKRNDGR